MNIQIRLANYIDKEDAKTLIDLLDAYAQDEMGGNAPLSDYVRQNLPGELAKRSFAFSVLCFVDGKPAGLVNCFEAFSTFKCKPLINIHDVVVVSEFRGLQLSQKMLQKVEEVAREQGCCKLTLEVLEGNEVAKRAYIKFGFAGYELDPKMGSAQFWQKEIGN